MEVIVIISVVILLALGALFVIPKSQNKGKSKGTDSGAGMTSRSFTKEEISKHNTRKDCWIIIKDKVYDVTPYVEEHPGGDAILNNAGGDSTRGFFLGLLLLILLLIPHSILSLVQHFSAFHGIVSSEIRN
ncbi:cytochrome B5-like protein [Miscanthus floridulus]|uniref:cytochrome B5-like protein n=1 Tax=Miscanthus floridulus TaxID=154761 RepID=UPI0034581F78